MLGPKVNSNFTPDPAHAKTHLRIMIDGVKLLLVKKTPKILGVYLDTSFNLNPPL